MSKKDQDFIFSRTNEAINCLVAPDEDQRRDLLEMLDDRYRIPPTAPL